MRHGRVRPAIAALPAYRPGRSIAQVQQDHGVTDSVKLASNENPFGPIPEVLEAINAAAADINRYADHRAQPVRDAVAAMLGVDSNAVTVGCGSVGLIQQLFLTFVDAGDEVVSPWRSFEVYPIETMMMGATFVTTALTTELELDLDAVVSAITDKTKLVLLANPNNPSGTARTVAQLDAALAAIPDDVVVLLDEAYREFVDPEFGDSVRELLPRYPNLAISRSMSKAFGLAGLRTGYLVADPELIVEVDKMLVPFAVNGLAQAAAVAAVQHRDKYQPMIDLVRSERSRVVGELQKMGWNVPRPQGNFVYLPLAERTDAVALDLERSGVITRPFSGEGLRVTIGLASENDRFLAALSHYTP